MKRILIVENDKSARLHLVNTFEQSCFEIEIVQNVETARESLSREHPISLCILPALMVGGTVGDVFSGLPQSVLSQTIFAVMSAFPSLAKAQLELEFVKVHWLHRPLQDDELAKMLKLISEA